MVKNVEKILNEIKKYSRENSISEIKQWDNSFIKKQIDKRNLGDRFELKDHIRAMIYAMLSSSRSWDCMLSNVDESGRLTKVDKAFFDYNVDELIKASADELINRVTYEKLGNPYIKKQISALKRNICFLKSLDESYESVDEYYERLNNSDETKWTLVNALANTEENKLQQLGVPLVCEYLRNIGFDIGKPDRHICRIVSNKYLGLIKKDNPSQKEVYRLLLDIRTDKWSSAAEIDYYLWAFCAKGYMDICNIKDPQCKKCILNKVCNKGV